MRYKLLGNSGLRVSELALGTMTFGEDWGWGASKDESGKILDTYLEAGGNFIDTADFYTEGTSETFLGDFLKDNREHVVLATKYTDHAPTKDPNASGNHRKNLVQSLDASLERLDTDYIDLYWVHTPDFMTPIEEVMRALDDQVRQGKILYVGISDAPAWLVAQANTLASLRGWTPFVATQVEYNLAERTSEREIIPMSQAFDIGVLAWSPLASGLLTGKYTRERGGGEKRLDTAAFKEQNERNLSIARAVDEIADELGATSAQIALAWVRQRGASPILGARKLSQLEDNLKVLDIELEEAHMQRLNDVSAIDLGFPHDFVAGAREVIYGGMFDQIDHHRAGRSGLAR